MRSIWHYMMYQYSEQWKPGKIPDRPLLQIYHPLTKYSREGHRYMDVEKPTDRGMGGVRNRDDGYDDIGKKPESPAQKKY